MLNAGNDSALNCLAAVSSSDPYVVLTDVLNRDIYYSIGTIESGKVVDSLGGFLMVLSPEVPVGHEILFKLTMTDCFGNIWTDSFVIAVGL